MSLEHTVSDQSGYAIRMLKEANQAAKRYDSPGDRAEFFEDMMDAVPTESLLGHYLLVTCSIAYAPKPSVEDTYIAFDGLQGIALTTRCSYRVIPKLKINGLVLDMIKPDIFSVGADELDRFKNLELIVPVAGVESCVNADRLMRGDPPSA